MRNDMMLLCSFSPECSLGYIIYVKSRSVALELKPEEVCIQLVESAVDGIISHFQDWTVFKMGPDK